MKTIIQKYRKRLDILKDNRAETVDSNTDAENEVYDQLIKQVAEFIRDISNISDITYIMKKKGKFYKSNEDDSVIFCTENQINRNYFMGICVNTSDNNKSCDYSTNWISDIFTTEVNYKFYEK